MSAWQWIGLIGLGLAGSLALGLVVGRVIRAGSSHMDEPLSNDWRPGGKPYI